MPTQEPAKPDDGQPTLFELSSVKLHAPRYDEELLQLGHALSPLLRIGTMSWSYPGWHGLVYRDRQTERVLAAHGLTAYTEHPLLRTVEIDRSFYAPLAAEVFRDYAAQVPDDFRFVVKAPQECALQAFPEHARYGKRAGQSNPHYLDPVWARQHAIEPLKQGAGGRAGVLLFQFSPELQREGAPQFADRLRRFLSALPAAPFAYAVELRNRDLMSAEYDAALAATGAIHCHNVWTQMPDILSQARRLSPQTRRPLLIRWLLREGDEHAVANTRCAPFSKLVWPDDENLRRVLRLVRAALQHQVPVFLTLDNKAEGCAPLTAARVARALMAGD